MNEHHAELLRRVLDHDLDERAAEVIAASEDAKFAAELASLLELRRRLESEATERARLIADARDRTGEPGEDLVARFVDDRVAEARTKRRIRRVAIATLVAAAVVLLVARTGRRTDPEERPPPDERRDVILGATGIYSLDPNGDDADFSRFSFGTSLNGGTFRVTVFDARGEEVPGGRSPHLDATEWRPDPREVARWPAEIEWEVQWFDGSGALHEVASARARRR